MKTKILLIVTTLLLFSTTSIVAQQLPFARGTSNLNFGINFGSNYLMGGTGEHKVNIPQFLVAFDHGITDKVGIGYISIGGQWGLYGFTDPRNIKPTWDWDYQGYGTAIVTYAAFKALYHFDFYSMTREPFFAVFDVYAGPYAGVAVRFKTVQYADRANQAEHAGGPIFGLIAGVRYNFSSAVGVFTEVNIEGQSGISFGLTARLHK